MSNDSSNKPASDDTQNQSVAIEAPKSPVGNQEAPATDPKNAPANKVPWGPWSGMAYAVFVFFAAQFIIAYILYAVANLRGLSESTASDWLNTVPMQFVFILCVESIIFAAIVWFVKLKQGSLRQIGFTKPRWSYIAWALGGFAVYFVIYVLLYGFVSKYVPGIDVNQEQDIGFKDVSGTLTLTLTFISLVVLPPIVEETVFRGFIFAGLRGRYTFIVTALLTSVLFAAAHLEFGNDKPLLWIAALDTFTLSMVMCYVRQKTGSILPTILIHAIKNGVAFLVLFVFVI